MTVGPPRRRAWVEQIMGMPISVHVRAAETDRADIATGVAQTFAHLRKVDSVLSVWRADSDVLRLRRSELDTDQAHPWVAEVARLCAEAEKATGGLFTSRLSGPDGTTGFDPTGVAKGWGVVGAARYLEVLPGVAFSINAGGDVVCGIGRGMTGVESTWRIGIEDPRSRGAIVEVVAIQAGALATSGSAARGAHIVDPRTGDLVDHPGSVTVVGPDLVWCDIWATAGYVDPVGVGARLAADHPAYRLIQH